MRLALTWLAVAACAFAQVSDPVRDELLRRMDSEHPRYAQLSKQIWDFAEVGFQERRSSELLQTELKAAGFRVESGVANMPTAFVASWGSGKPVIAILAEYDALPGLSQQASPGRQAIKEGEPGHGCGHNLFGAAAVHAGIAARRAMEEQKIAGTLRVYGTPAEEGGGGKIHMVRAGLFKDVDAAITWHPWDRTFATNQVWLATVSGRFRFTGRASHAAGAPDAGRSALDAAMIMTHAIDLMREHVPQETRMHYILEKAGSAVNIVPETTEVVMMARHTDSSVLAGIWERVLNCAQAGALATGTEMNFNIVTSYANVIPNRTITSALDRNLRRVGGYKYTAEEQQFADAIRKTLPKTDTPMDAHEQIEAMRNDVLSVSTDVGDVSWNVPTAQMAVASWVPGTPAHTWQSTAASGTTIGQKGMLLAAKALGLTALDLLTDEKLRNEAKSEFEKTMAGREYKTLHPTDIQLH
jgi:aminobenzoyl-glutamate utilization protein B